uniref:Uncharacterized protein n=1 Tax=Arundo donax TaxID=35708 RepID=A0A0A9C8Q9_ARUDO
MIQLSLLLMSRIASAWV